VTPSQLNPPTHLLDVHGGQAPSTSCPSPKGRGGLEGEGGGRGGQGGRGRGKRGGGLLLQGL
jgi:hypothetical protein